MKFTLTLCAILSCGVAFGSEPVSVLNHGAATPAQAPAPATEAPLAPPVVVAPPLPLVAVQQPSRSPCANGKCKLYSVEPHAYETHRHRVLGGTVTRKGTRTVVRPVR